MGDNSDYRLYLEEKFEGMGKLINAHFINLDERLEKIEIQTTKTNGRVTELEHEFISHPINCPQGQKIEELNKTMEDVKFFVKYPKLAVAIASVFIMIFLGSAIAFYSGLKTNLKQSRENKELLIKSDTTIKK